MTSRVSKDALPSHDESQQCAPPTSSQNGLSQTGERKARQWVSRCHWYVYTATLEATEASLESPSAWTTTPADPTNPQAREKGGAFNRKRLELYVGARNIAHEPRRKLQISRIEAADVQVRNTQVCGDKMAQTTKHMETNEVALSTTCGPCIRSARPGFSETSCDSIMPLPCVSVCVHGSQVMPHTKACPSFWKWPHTVRNTSCMMARWGNNCAHLALRLIDPRL